MEDVVGKTIKENDLVVYCKREDTKQVVTFGIVIDPKKHYTQNTRVTLIGIDTKTLKLETSRVAINLGSNGYKISSIYPYQVFVVDKALLPEKVVKALTRAKSTHDGSFRRAELRRNELKKLTPQQRLIKNIQNNKSDGTYDTLEDIQRDIMTV